jgi:hypothetical protein
VNIYSPTYTDFNQKAVANIISTIYLHCAIQTMEDTLMKKSVLIAIFISAFFLNVSAQRTADIGLATGVVNYVGDLGNEKNFPVSSASPGIQINVRNFLNNPAKSGMYYRPFSMEMRFSWHRLQYDETDPIGNLKGGDLRNYYRGIGFRNDLFGASLNFTYTFYKNKFVPLYKSKRKWCYFLLAGIGVYHGTPKADLFRGDISLDNRYYQWDDGTLRDVAQNKNGIGNIIQKDGVFETRLNEWHTEGQESNAEVSSAKTYSTTNIGFPLGFGVRYGLNKYVTFSMEVDYYYFLTDYLDDVSGRYATDKELHSSFPDREKYELAKYISDPSGKGSTGYIANSARRGNPKLKDSYTFVNLEVSYKFQLRKKGLWSNLSMR